MRGQMIAVAGFANKLLLFFIRLTPRAIVAKIAKGLMSRKAPAPSSRTRTALNCAANQTRRKLGSWRVGGRPADRYSGGDFGV
jgi:hypothetical protein